MYCSVLNISKICKNIYELSPILLEFGLWVFVYIVGKYKIHLPPFRNTPEKLPNRCLFYMFLKLIQINLLESCSCKVYSIQHYVIKFVSDLRQVRGFLRVLRFPPPPIKLTTMIYLKYC